MTDLCFAGIFVDCSKVCIVDLSAVDANGGFPGREQSVRTDDFKILRINTYIFCCMCIHMLVACHYIFHYV